MADRPSPEYLENAGIAEADLAHYPRSWLYALTWYDQAQRWLEAHLGANQKPE